jgi:ABC-type Mn2+/Zn2+ transport system ATPase subunit
VKALLQNGKTVVFLSEEILSVLLFMSDVICLKQMKSLDMSIASVIEQGNMTR